MEKRVLGKTGMLVSILGFGGAEIGFGKAAESTVREILASALDAGLNVIDTAECYESSEESIGNTVSHRRNEYFLFTKCGHKGSYTSPSWDKEGISNSIEQSLKRLKTDYLDLVQLHSCSKETLARGEAIEALQAAKAAGKTRFIGYSGDGQDAVCAINTGLFDTLQTSVSIADQEAIELTIPLAIKHGLGVIAKRPVANAAWLSTNRPENPYHQPYWERLQKLRYDFINGDLTASIETALRFTLSIQGIHTAIVGTTKPGRWHENAQHVSRGPLSPKKFEEIRARWAAMADSTWHGEV